MGTKACDRNGCENILCDRYSDLYGYICDECFDELVAEGGKYPIEEFMYLDKDLPSDPAMDYRHFYDKIFPRG